MDCRHIAFVSFLLAVLVKASHQAGCPSGFEKKGDNCYRLVTEAKPHDEAGKACRAMGAFLAEPRTKASNAIVKDIAKNTAHVWLGATDSASEGVWKWQTNGDALTFFDWHEGEPNNWSNFEDCLEFRQTMFQWNDDPCVNNHPFLCQINPRGCPSGFEKKGDNCYKLVRERKSHGEAAKACVAMGAFLAEPRTATENQIVRDIAKKHTHDVWLGATDSGSEGTWKWLTNGDALTVNDWGVGEPNDMWGNEHCLVWKQNTLHWNDQPCIGGIDFLCQAYPTV